MDGLRVDVTANGSGAVVKLDGEMDMLSAPKFVQALDALFASNTYQITVDCEDLSFMDSSGIGALIAAHKRITEESGSITLTHPCDQVLKVLAIIKIDELLGLGAAPVSPIE